MRGGVSPESLARFMREIGKEARSPGRVYLVGGSTALLLGIRNQTIDIDIKLDPEPQGVFESIARIKEELSLSVELASPDHFLPSLPRWRDRSLWIAAHGQVDFYHYDLYSQVLSKILRNHGHDLDDARSFVKMGQLSMAVLLELFEAITPDLIRYPAINAVEFRRSVAAFIQEQSHAAS